MGMRFLVAALVLLLTLPVQALDFFQSKKDNSSGSSNGPSLEQRVQTLERRISTLSTIVLRLDSMQQEIQQLRGDVELQSHDMESLKKRQIDLYNDMDQRVSKITGEAPANMPIDASAPMTPPTRVPAGNQPQTQVQTQAPEPAGEPNWESTPIATEPSQPAARGGQYQSAGSDLPPVVRSGSAAPTTTATAPSNPGQLQTSVAVTPRASTPYREAKGEKSSYQTAFNLLMDRKYDQAVNAFRSFLQKYPNSRLADNAQYWLAEANYVTRNFDAAKIEFNKVMTEHPRSTKVSDALLKIGYIQYEKKQWSAARETLNRVVNRYPNSTASQLAKKRLSKMRSQGH
jgi:tol-pal system protein YbgF